MKIGLHLLARVVYSAARGYHEAKPVRKGATAVAMPTWDDLPAAEREDWLSLTRRTLDREPVPTDAEHVDLVLARIIGDIVEAFR